MSSISDINLKRTDTTHDLSQKAEKRYSQIPTRKFPLVRSARLVHCETGMAKKYLKVALLPKYHSTKPTAHGGEIQNRITKRAISALENTLPLLYSTSSTRIRLKYVWHINMQKSACLKTYTFICWHVAWQAGCAYYTTARLICARQQ